LLKRIFRLKSATPRVRVSAANMVNAVIERLFGRLISKKDYRLLR
jgi:hypothetical protein